LRGGAWRRGGHQAPLLLQVDRLGRHGEQEGQAAVQAENCKYILAIWFPSRSFVFNLHFHLQKSKKDVLNFDTEFTKEEPTLTPINPELIKTINQDEFKGFSFYNTQFGKLTGGPINQLPGMGGSTSKVAGNK
jgi:hypothetical protein